MFVLVAASGLVVTAQVAPIARDYKIANLPVNFLFISSTVLVMAGIVDNILNGLARPTFGWVSDHIGRENTMAIVFTLRRRRLLGARHDRQHAVDVHRHRRPRLLHLGRDLQPVSGDLHRHLRLASMRRLMPGCSTRPKARRRSWFLPRAGCRARPAAGTPSSSSRRSRTSLVGATALFVVKPMRASAQRAALAAMPMAARRRVARDATGHMSDPTALARELNDAYARKTIIPTPSSRDGGIDLGTAYAIEARYRASAARRRPSDRRLEGRLRQQGDVARAQARDAGVGAHVRRHRALRRLERRHAVDRARCSRRRSSRRSSSSWQRRPNPATPVAVLEATEWIALGFEIIDCVFPDWKFQPADFVAARGLHAALVVGEPVYVEPDDIAQLVDRPARVHGSAAEEQRAGRGRRGEERAEEPGALRRRARTRR